MSFKAEVKVFGEHVRISNGMRFATWAEAHAYGLDLGNRWTAVEEMHTVESSDPVTHCWRDGHAESVPNWSEVET
jgi:hypothetical protein